MDINTEKLKKEKKRQGLTYEKIGALCDPPLTRQGVWIAIRKSKTLSSIGRIAKALGYDDPRDLIK